MLGALLGPQQLAQLRHYQYRGVDRSLLSRHVLNPFWNWLVTCVPLCVA